MDDDRYWRNRLWAGTKTKKVPSDYFRDHWLATFIVDRNGITVRHQVGVDNMSWSTDFPHHGNDWPYSRKVIAEPFEDVPADERDKIVCTNDGARFWGSRSRREAARGQGRARDGRGPRPRARDRAALPRRGRDGRLINDLHAAAAEKAAARARRNRARRPTVAGFGGGRPDVRARSRRSTGGSTSS
jgi:hypothetical protein